MVSWQAESRVSVCLQGVINTVHCTTIITQFLLNNIKTFRVSYFTTQQYYQQHPSPNPDQHILYVIFPQHTDPVQRTLIFHLSFMFKYLSLPLLCNSIGHNCLVTTKQIGLNSLIL